MVSDVSFYQASIQQLFMLQTMCEEALLCTHTVVFVMMHSEKLIAEF